MASVAKHQRLAASGCHDLRPIRFLSAFILVEVLERPDMMNLDLFGHPCGSAHFTDLCEKPFFQFRPNTPSEVGSIIGILITAPLYFWFAAIAAGVAALVERSKA